MMAHRGPSPLASPLDAAQVLTARGWTVFPCDHPDAALHCTGTATRCREGRCGADDDPGKRGKHPRVPWGRLHAPVSAAQLRDWFGEGLANVAIACGPSGLLVVDEDTEGAFAAFAAAVGETVPDTFRVRTARGWHWYFAVPVDPATGERVPVGNAPGALAGWHCDVRGGASASAPHGGYVIGPGSMHASGIVYVAPDPYGEVLTAPGWLLAAVSAGPPASVEGSPTRAGSRNGHGTAGGARWDDDPRYGTAAALRAQFARHCGEVVDRGGPFRWQLFLAARDGWRLVGLGLLDEADMLIEVAHCVHRVWAAAPDDRDEAIVFDEARPAAQRSPWELTSVELRARALATRDPLVIESAHAFARPSEAPTSDDRMINRTTYGNVAPENVTEGDVPPVDTVDTAGIDPADLARLAAEEAEAKARAQRVRDQVEWLDVRAEAAAVRAARNLVEIEPMDLRAALLDPRPEYLVPGMIRRDGLAAIFGMPGSGKSFLALDIALSLTSGRPWDIGGGVPITRADGARGVVHYVMAEAAGTNTSRTAAWLAHHGKSVDDILPRYIPFDKAFTLTETGVRRYLPNVVRDKPDLIILDTLNAMSEGKESAGEDMAVIIRVLHTIREAADGCAVVIIAHSGLYAPDRMRGSNALEAGMDTVVKVAEQNGQHMVTTPRDRNGRRDAVEWPFRLHAVGMGGWDEAVPVVADHDYRPFGVEPGWSDATLPEPINDVITASRETMKGGRTEPRRGKREARVITLLLRALAGEVPTQDRILKLINSERPNRNDHMKPYAVSRGCALLVAEGIAEQVGTEKVPRYVVAAKYSRAEMPE